jgi:multiple antibiotic resistance protein
LEQGFLTATPMVGRSPIGVIARAIILTVGTLLPIMNPFSTIPLFLSLTAGMSPARRNRQARMACVYALALLVGFLLLGEAIIDFFGISVPGIRVAGGLIITIIGARMLFSAPAPKAAGEKMDAEAEIAFTPLAMPSLAGPGSLSVVITAASQINARNPQGYELVYLGVIIGMVIVVGIAFVLLRGAGFLARFLGPSGIDALTRIFGFLLIAIGMQFLLTGVSDFFGLAHA